MEKDKRIKKYDQHADRYAKIRFHQKIEAARKKLMNKATGKVLEVGVGTGANFAYYRRDDVEVTAVDFSSEMLKYAKRAATTYKVNAQFIQQDIDLLTFEPNTFDSIVSTLTLCSYPNPMETLNKFNDWCREDGKVLLLEHGLSSNRLLSFTLDKIDPLFRRISGCHCNRDMKKIMESSQLQIEQMERFWADIMYIIQAKPMKK